MSDIETGLHYPIKLDELPSSWSFGYVGEFVDTVQPGFASGKHNKGGAGIPHLRPMNVDQNGMISMEEIKFVSPDKDKKRLQVGDVLFNNTNSPVWVGKTAYVSEADDLAFSNHMTRVVFNDDVSPKYGALQLHYLWMSGYFLHRCTKHVNQASISSKTLADTVPFVVPASRDQQERIVAEIEKQFSRLDEAVTSLNRVKANLKRYKAAVLKAAVEGKLTEEWRKQNPDVEPASKLLERILAERRLRWEEAELAKMKTNGKEPKNDKWKEKFSLSACVNSEGLLSLPNGWCYTNMACLVEEPKYGTSKKCGYEVKGFGVLRIPNIKDGVINDDDLKYAEFDDTEAKAYDLREDDLLVIRSNGSLDLVGKAALVRELDCNYLYAGYLIRLRPIEKTMNGAFLQSAVSSSLLRLQIESKAKSTSGVNNINAVELKGLVVPVCGKEEQAEIVRAIEQRFSVVDHLLSDVQSRICKADILRQSILAEKFSGRDFNCGPTS